MELCFLRATAVIDVDKMKIAAEIVTIVFDVDYDLITEPFGDYSPNVVLERVGELRSRHLDDQDKPKIFVLFDENAVESHGAIILGRAIAQSRVAVVRWWTEPERTAATCLHELGHVFGLTNRHCDRDECLMYPHARDRQIQGKTGRQLYCEECWRTITNDTIYESLHNASQERRSKVTQGLNRVRAAVTTVSERVRRPKPLFPNGVVHTPRTFPDINQYQDEHSFLYAVLKFYGLGQDSEETGQ